MNFHHVLLSKTKQYLFNNLWFGENSRVRVHRDTLPILPLVQPDYSRKWGVDTSHWDGLVNFAVTKAAGASFVFIKAVDGTIPTRYFPENYRAAVAAGLPRSAYAWLYRNVNVEGKAQAQAFTTLLNQYPPSEGLPPVIDFEATKYAGVYSNPNFSDLRTWLVEFLRLGNPKSLLYSGKYYMDQFGACPEDIKAMLAGLFLANYSDLTPPLPLGWTEWKFLQFSASGDALLLAPGSTGKKELDLDYSAVEISPSPIPDTTSTIFDGVRRTTGERYGRKFSLIVSDPKKVRFEVVHVLTGDRRDIVSNIAKGHGAQVAWNGGEWDKSSVPYLPKDYSVSNGDLYVARKTFVPSLIVLEDDSLIIDYKSRADARQALSGLRYLIEGGMIPASLDGTEPEFTDNRARSIDGLNAQGHHMRLTVDGVYPFLGVTLKEAALIMLSFGAVVTFDEGGGGDTTEVINGILTNIPEDINPLTGEHVERRIPQFLLMYANGGTTMPNGTAKEKLGLTSKVRNAPRVGATEIKIISPYSTISFVGIVDDPDFPGNEAYKWFDMGPNPAKATENLYTPYKRPSEGERFTILTMPGTPPPSGGEVADVTWVKKDVSGTVLETWKGTLTKQ